MDTGTETTVEQKGNPLAEATPPVKGASKSKDKGKLYTAEQIKQLQAEASTEGGRRWKTEAERLQGEVTTAIQRLDDLEKDQDNRAIAEIGEDTAAKKQYLSSVAVRDKLRAVEARERAATQKEEQNKSDREEFEATQLESLIPTLASKYEVPEQTLKDLNIQDAEALERVAKTLSGKGTEETTEETEETPPFNPNATRSTATPPSELTVKSIQEQPMAATEEALAPKPPKK